MLEKAKTFKIYFYKLFTTKFNTKIKFDVFSMFSFQGAGSRRQMSGGRSQKNLRNRILPSY